MSYKGIFCVFLYILTTVPSGWSQDIRLSGKERPNIVLIVADDLGWSDVGWRDSEMYTPVLDRLARDGIILNQTYMQSSCSPSRGALMTGMYPFRLGLQHSFISAGRNEYLTDQYGPILPQYLKRLGYATHIVGKWHLGFCDWKYTPTHRGFDTFYGFYNAAEDYYTHIGKKNGYDFRDNEEVDWSAKGTYSTHLFTSRAQRIVRDHNQSTPLFLYLPFQAVHGPLEVPQSYIKTHCLHVREKARRIRCGMVAALDEAIGNVTQTLQDLGLADNTLLVFTTDNGGPTNKGSSNWPLRGSKTTLWEGNFSRVFEPGRTLELRKTSSGLSLRWAGDVRNLTTSSSGGNRAVSFLYSNNRRLLPGSASVFNGLMHVVDWLPTLLSAAGMEDSELPTSIDGLNMWQHIRMGKRRSPRKEFVYNIDEIKENAAIRFGRWKLIEGKAGNPGGWYSPPRGVPNRDMPKGKQQML